jgi:RNA polymerase sigma-70 factor, ECF subfamily
MFATATTQQEKPTRNILRPCGPACPSRVDAHRRAVAASRLRCNGSEPPEEGVVQDDRLRLIFTCCHPALATGAQVALALRLLGGFTTADIARAFLVPEPTMAQRLVRAKSKIRDAEELRRYSSR